MSGNQYTLGYSMLLDGNSPQMEQARDIVVDKQGYVYVTGGTTALTGFPLTNGLDFKNQSALGSKSVGSGGDMDAFLTKLDPNGNVVWSSRIGGTGYDRAYAIELDDFGNIVIGGRAGGGFTTTAGSYQTKFGGDISKSGLYGDQDAFIAQFDANTGKLNWSTYIGGNDGGIIRDLDVAADGSIHAVMQNVTSPVGQPITSDAMDGTKSGFSDMVYASISMDGRSLLYGTYIGSSQDNGREGYGTAIRVDDQGDINIVMLTDSNGLYTSANALQTTLAGGTDIYALKLDGATGGRTIKAATYIGGVGDENLETHQLAVDQYGNFIINATTHSSGLITSNNSFLQNFQGGSTNAYIVKISADATSILASTYFGSTNGSGGESIAVTDDSIIIVGPAGTGTNLPVTDTTTLSGPKGGTDGYIAVFDTDLATLKFSSTYGGSGDDTVRAVTVDDAGNIYFAGQTSSSDLRLFNAFDSQKSGQWAAFSGKLILTNPALPHFNTAPMAASDSIVMKEDSSAAINVLANDTDADGDVLSITGFSQGAHASVFKDALGNLVYTPVANYFGSDSFKYSIDDGNGGTSTATVNVTVVDVPEPLVNTPPVAKNDVITMNEDTSITINVLANDTDADGDVLSISSFSQGAHASVTKDAAGNITFAPDSDFFGNDSFNYAVDDGNGGTSTATVNVTVLDVPEATTTPTGNHDPIADDFSVAITKNLVAKALNHASDLDGDTLYVESITQAEHGRVSFNKYSHLIYHADDGFSGLDFFTYTISDGHAGTDTAAVYLSVGDANGIWDMGS